MRNVRDSSQNSPSSCLFFPKFPFVARLTATLPHLVRQRLHLLCPPTVFNLKEGFYAAFIRQHTAVYETANELGCLGVAERAAQNPV
jgi:hypothetical protein